MQRKLFTLLLAGLCCCTVLQAASHNELTRLEADMQKYFSTNDRDSFTKVAEELKNESKQAGEDRLFYEAWSNQAIYEAAHQNYSKADEMAKALGSYAAQQGSNIGKYFARHTEAAILFQKDDYEPAEQTFLKAVDILHQFFPKESAAEDLLYLMKIAYLCNDHEKAKQYAHQLLAEPGLTPHHKGSALNRLSAMAFEENDVEEYNRLYEEMKRLMHTDGIRSQNLFSEVNYHIINRGFRQALRLADWLGADTCAERKAIIYHRMGDDGRAYEYMVLYKRLADSIAHTSNNTEMANLYLRMNNEHLRLEREVLEHKNTQLHNRFYIIGGLFLITILLFFIFRWRRVIRLLKNDKLQLEYEKNDAERALEDLNELSFYESKDQLPLTSAVRPNDLCSYLTTATQGHCHQGVTMMFVTSLPDELEIKTNADALKTLLKHLLDYSARFTYKGTIELSCAEVGKNILFKVTDTSTGLSGQHQNRFVGMFAEQGNKLRYVGMNFNICQSITRLLQGRIWHDVDYTKGTRFCVELPQEPTN